jgi:hypothetical protein
MFDVLPTTSTIPDTMDPDLDMALAEGAALYLTRQGLDHRAIVGCLVDEFELDRATAELIAELVEPDLEGR